mgnify:CR=1 FL=1
MLTCAARQETWKPIACCVWTALTEALSRLGEDCRRASPSEAIQAMAYSRLGQTEKARQVLQVGIYNALVLLFNDLGNYLQLCQEQDFLLACRRAQGLVQAFAVERLHPGLVFPLYLLMAQGWIKRGEKDRALDALEQYTALASGPIFPMRLHGDEFFNQLEGWLDQALELGGLPPRESPSSSKAWCAASQRRRISPPCGRSPGFRPWCGG